MAARLDLGYCTVHRIARTHRLGDKHNGVRYFTPDEAEVIRQHAEHIHPVQPPGTITMLQAPMELKEPGVPVQMSRLSGSATCAPSTVKL